MLRWPRLLVLVVGLLHWRTTYAAALLPPTHSHFVHVNDLTKSQLRTVLDSAKTIKRNLHRNEFKPFAHKTLAMVFTKPSTRTRVSFESGFFRLGGHAMCLGEEVGIGKREATKDIARVLSSMNDLVMARLYSHDDMLELAKYSSVPVINGLTDYNRPCQIVADALTIEEIFKSTIDHKKIVYVGDGNNIVHSWIELADIVPIEFVCACPPGYEPDAQLVARVQKNGVGSVTITHDPVAAVAGADAIYADVWASMQQKEEAQEREETFMPYQVNGKLMAASGKESTIFLHCLPAERGRETTDEVMESTQSHVFQQAENRMHAQNAIMTHCCGIAPPDLN